MSHVYDAESFGTQEYDRAIATGLLGTMVFWGKDRQCLERLRARVIACANAKKRRHILQTTLIDQNHMEIKFLGTLDNYDQKL